MKKGASYLRYAACAAFLAAAAWTLAFFVLREQSPETVTAERAEVTLSVLAEGTVWRDEKIVVCDDENAYIARKTGDMVSGGSVIAVPEDMTDAYFAHLELSGGAAPDKIEMQSLVYAPQSGIFSTFVDGYEGASREDITSVQPFIPPGAVGKIVLGGWYFIADTPEYDEFRTGQSVYLSLPDKCAATVISAGDGRIVLRCREGLESVINTRKAAFKISLSETQGIKIPDAALHHDENGTFVYVLRAGLSERCDVEIIRTCEGYCLAKEDEIRENMQIVLDG